MKKHYNLFSRMRKPKLLIRLVPLLLIFFIFMSSCNDDDINISIEESIGVNNELKISILKNSDVLLNSKLVQKLNKLQEKLKSTQSPKGKNSNINFSIDTHSIKYIEKGGYHSYTFSIIDNNVKNNKVTNLLLSLNKKRKYDSYIVRYDFTPEEMKYMSFEDFTSSEIEYQSIDFDHTDVLAARKSSSSIDIICVDTQILVPCCDGQLCHASSSGCIVNGGTGYEWVTDSSECTNIGSGSGTSDDSGNYDGEGGSTSGGGDGGIVTALNTVPYTSKLKNFTSGTLNSVERTYYNRDSDINNTINNYLIQKNFSDTSKSESKASLKLGESLNLNFEQFNWTFINRDSEGLKNIQDLLYENLDSQEAKDWANSQIQLESSSDGIPLKYKPGKIKNRENLKYTHVGTNGAYTVYKLEDGSKVLLSGHSLNLNGDGKLVSPLITYAGEFYYIKTSGLNEWSNFIITKEPSLAKGLEAMFILSTKETATLFARYVLPIEDIKVIFTGKDLDGNEVSRLQAGGFLLLTAIPGSKALKAVKFVPNGALKWGKLITVNGKTFKYTSKIVNGVVDFGTYQSKKFRTALGIANDATKQAHHILSRNLRTHRAIQKVAKSKTNPFHIDEVLNGIPVDKWINQPNHNAYDARVRSLLDKIPDNLSAEDTYNRLIDIINGIEEVIKNNPNKHLNDLIF